MKKKVAAMFAAVTVLFSGCSLNAGIDTMLTSPKLSAQHEQIYKALISEEGSNITLKYPKSGTNLSAFTVADIDNDNEDEAIVFYAKNSISSEGSSLRMNVLDHQNGKWRSVYDYSADAENPDRVTEVEKVIVSELGVSDKMNIIVGYNMVNPAEKHVCVYNYGDGKMEKNLEQPYSIIDIRDIDGDDKNELFLLENQQAASNGNTTASAKARVLKLDEEGHYLENYVDLNPDTLEFKQLSYGSLDDGDVGIYIDEAVGTNSLRTEILSFRNNELKKLYGKDAGEPVVNEGLGMIRPVANRTMDINKDGVLEIPVNEPFLGYANALDTEKLYMTSWYEFEDGKLVKKYESYFSIIDGYAFIFPKRWQGQVTVRMDSINNEVVICKFTGEISNSMTELMRIASSEESVIEDKVNQGYMEMNSCLVWIPVNSEEPLVPTVSEVMFNLKSIE